MGKFNVKVDMERLKAALARSASKDNALSSSLKREESESTLAKKSTLAKRLRPSTELAGVESSIKRLTPSSAMVDQSTDHGKGFVEGTGDAVKTTSNAVKLKPFFEEVTKAFSGSTSDESNPASSGAQKFRLSFNKAAMALYAQYEVFSGFESIEGPLQDKVADLIQKLADAEADLATANEVIAKKDAALEKSESLGKKADEVIAKKDAALEKSESLRKKADDVIEVLTSDLEAVRKKGEVEVGRLQDRIAYLQENIDRFFQLCNHKEPSVKSEVEC